LTERNKLFSSWRRNANTQIEPSREKALERLIKDAPIVGTSNVKDIQTVDFQNLEENVRKMKEFYANNPEV
jgi:hypothetical protein